VFASAKLGPLTLRNRIIKSATFEGMTKGALVTDELIGFHRRHAAGGIGISTVAYCAVAPEGRTERNQIWMRPEALPGLRRLTDAVPRARPYQHRSDILWGSNTSEADASRRLRSSALGSLITLVGATSVAEEAFVSSGARIPSPVGIRPGRRACAVTESRCLSGHTSLPERELPSEADATHLRADRGVNAPERGRGGEPSSATARKLAKVGDWLLADQASAMSQSGRSSWIGR
jgi:NADH:flavin oxidoreductase / NADH oxidase family